MKGFVAEAVGAKVHWHKEFRAKIAKSAKGLFGGHVILAKFWTVVGSDG